MARLIVLVIALLALPRAAVASDVAALLPWVEDDAAVVVRLEPGALAAVAAAARKIPEVEGVLNLATVGSAAALGFNPFVEAGWHGAGLGDGPALVQLFAMDRDAAWRATPGMRGAPLWRSRLVLRAADPGRAASTIAGALALRDRVRLDGDAIDAAALAGLLGAPASRGAGIGRALERGGVFVVARLPALGAFVFAHRHDDLIVVDVVVPFAGGALTWAAHGRDLLARLAPGPGVTPTGAGAALARPGIALWLRPARVTDALEAREWQRAAPGSAARRHGRCRAFRELGQNSHFLGASARVTPVDGALAIELAWQPRADVDLAAALATQIDPVLDPRAPDLALGAALWLAGTDGLRSLPRSLLFREPWETPLRAVKSCGPASALALYAFGWSELAGLFLDEVADLDASARSLVSSLGNLSVVISRPGPDLREGIAAAEAAVAAPASHIVAGWFDLLFGHRDSGEGRRSWGRGPIRTYQLRRAVPISAFAAGPASVTWASETALRAVAGPRPIAELHADLQALRDAKVLPPPWSALLEIGDRLDARVDFEGSLLLATLRLGLR